MGRLLRGIRDTGVSQETEDEFAAAVARGERQAYAAIPRHERMPTDQFHGIPKFDMSGLEQKIARGSMTPGEEEEALSRRMLGGMSGLEAQAARAGKETDYARVSEVFRRLFRAGEPRKQFNVTDDASLGDFADANRAMMEAARGGAGTEELRAMDPGYWQGSPGPKIRDPAKWEARQAAREEELGRRRESLRTLRLNPLLRGMELDRERVGREEEWFDKTMGLERERMLGEEGRFGETIGLEREKMLSEAEQFGKTMEQHDRTNPISALSTVLGAYAQGQQQPPLELVEGLLNAIRGLPGQAVPLPQTKPEPGQEKPLTLTQNARAAGVPVQQYLQKEIGEASIGDWLRETWKKPDQGLEGMLQPENRKTLRSFMSTYRPEEWKRWEAGDPNVWVNRTGTTRKNLINLNYMRLILGLKPMTWTEYMKGLNWMNPRRTKGWGGGGGPGGDYTGVEAYTKK